MKALLVIALLAATAHAGVRRYAVIVGNNAGLADEQTLRYAETDAQQLAAVLGELGGVADQDQIVLRGATVEKVKRALISINARIQSDHRAGDLVVLYVYYSGHGDEQSLHLGDQRLALSDLESYVTASTAEVRVLVIDACRSGSITRVKGKPLASDAATALPSEGLIVLTASTLGEDAQESDEIAGSFFTHHLISGLRGAADDNGDRVVTLDEAFRYTRDRTIATSSRTFAGVQHPTFRYDLRGRGDIALSEVGARNERGTLSLPPGAGWLVFGRGIVSEVDAEAKRRTLSLRPGSYRVRGLTRDAMLEGTIEVIANRDTTVDVGTLSRSMYARLVRKGKGRFLRTAGGPIVGATVGTAFNDVWPGAIAGWSFVRPSITISPRITGVWMEQKNTGTASIYAADVRLSRVWELERFSFDLGITVGGERAHDPVPVGPTTSVGAHFDASVGMVRQLARRLYVAGELGVQTHYLKDSDGGANLVLGIYSGAWL